MDVKMRLLVHGVMIILLIVTPMDPVAYIIRLIVRGIMDGVVVPVALNVIV